MLSAHVRTWKVDEQPSKKPEKDEGTSAVAIVKSVRGAHKHRETCGKRQLSCVSQDIEPPDSATISGKGKECPYSEGRTQLRYFSQCLRSWWSP